MSGTLPPDGSPFRRSGAPTGDAPRLLPLGGPRRVEVRTGEDGEPLYVRLPGKTARKVETVREAWRIDDEWWRQPISREYRSVVLDDGRPVTLFHDLLDDRWYAQRGE